MWNSSALISEYVIVRAITVLLSIISLLCDYNCNVMKLNKCRGQKVCRCYYVQFGCLYTVCVLSEVSQPQFLIPAIIMFIIQPTESLDNLKTVYWQFNFQPKYISQHSASLPNRNVRNVSLCEQQVGIFGHDPVLHRYRHRWEFNHVNMKYCHVRIVTICTEVMNSSNL